MMRLLWSIISLLDTPIEIYIDVYRRLNSSSSVKNINHLLIIIQLYDIEWYKYSNRYMLYLYKIYLLKYENNATKFDIKHMLKWNENKYKTVILLSQWSIEFLLYIYLSSFLVRYYIQHKTNVKELTGRKLCRA